MPFTRVRPFLILAAVAAFPAAASAQRNGDVSGGLDHQPTYGEVHAREKAAGVLPPPAVQEQQLGAVDNIYKNLMHQERSSGIVGGSQGAPPGVAAPR